MTSTMTFVPTQSPPLARTISPFKDPRPPPCTPGKTERLWDEYEKRAVVNAQRRETAVVNTQRRAPKSARVSSGTVLDIIKSYDPNSSPRVPCMSPPGGASPQFDFGLTTSYRHTARSASTVTVAICKTCKQPISSSPGVCEKCKKTIILSPTPGETTTQLNRTTRNFASTDLPQLQKPFTQTSTSPNLAAEHPIRVDSLQPPLHLQLTPRTSLDTPRHPSLTDPASSFLRLHIPRKPVPLPGTHPPTPTTPPSISSSYAQSTPTTPFPPPYRHPSATPSELGALYPFVSPSAATTAPPSVCRASYSLQNTTSAWDDWDSDEEGEGAGLAGYWKGRKWRESLGSLGAQEKGSRKKQERTKGRGEGSKAAGKKRRGFVRVISCGCVKE